ncbi:MAG: hypothetical protein QOE31_2539 [Solirubrobacteraceae bacterium]|nr:hypothetical protein [Solirubrobacteraceae bacterium]
MRTLVISDLHLGVNTAADVLRRPAALEILCARLDGIDRLVLLGDTLELRHGPARDALAAAEPAMRAIGDALGPDGEVVILAGNHDHALAAGWLDWRGRRETPEPLELEQRVAPQYASWIAKRLAGWLAPASVEIAYPGIWLRDDVYATHGHYLDAHCTIPTPEVLAARTMARMVGELPAAPTPDDYEALLAPTYAWIQSSAQRAAPTRRSAGGGTAINFWNELEGSGRRRTARRAAYRGAFKLAVAAVNRAGLGPMRAEVSGPAMRQDGLAAMTEVAGRLGLTAPHLVFGHTHRAGMLGGDDASEWRTTAGTTLHNAGCWVFETHFMGSRPRGASPYWPGGVIVLDASGPPRLERLLGDVPAGVLLGH